jgi:hypothetical protein
LGFTTWTRVKEERNIITRYLNVVERTNMKPFMYVKFNGSSGNGAKPNRDMMSINYIGKSQVPVSITLWTAEEQECQAPQYRIWVLVQKASRACLKRWQ